jgi:putative ABC transport system permease protein
MNPASWGPLRLLRFPALLGAVLAAAVVLGGVTVASTLFLDAAGGAILARTLRNETRAPALTVALNSSVDPGMIAYRQALLDQELAGTLDRSLFTVTSEQLRIANGDSEDDARLAFRTEFLRNLDVVEDAGGRGAWIADYTAERLGVSPGDSVTVTREGVPTEVRVQGVYRDLLNLPITAYWAPLDDAIYPAVGADRRPPPLVFLDLRDYVQVSSGLQDPQESMVWEYPYDRGRPSIEQARAFADRLRGFLARSADANDQLFQTFARANVREPLTGLVDLSDGVLTSIRAPVESVGFAGVFVALLVIAGAGLFVVRRRRVEFVLLHARGASPIRLGLRTAVEAALPIVAGAAVGFLGGWAAVKALGPDGPIDPSALRAAATATAIAAALAIVLLGVVVALTVRAEAEERSTSLGRLAARIPWEVGVLVLAGAALYEVLTAVPEVDTANPAALGGPVDRLVLLFPILFVAGVAMLAVRLLRRWVPALRSRGSNLPTAPYLAARRLASGSKAAGWLVVAAALSVGMLVDAAALSASVRATAGQRAALLIGGEVSATVTGEPPDPNEAPFPATLVQRIGRAEFVAAEQDDELEVLAVDPASFERAAYWQGAFSSSSLDDLMTALSREGERVPVVLVGTSAPDQPVLRLASYDVPVERVGQARRFPGQVGDRPTLVVSAARLDEALAARDTSTLVLAGSSEVWANTSAEELDAFLSGADSTVIATASVAAARDTAPYLAVSWMFGFLQALGLVTGAIALVGAFLYLQSRQRQGEAAYALMRRMGLARGSHLRSIGLELTGVLVAAALLGVVLAIVASAVTFQAIALGGTGEATPLYRTPGGVLGLVLLVAMCVAWVGAWLVQRRADRTRVAEVLRLAA